MEPKYLTITVKFTEANPGTELHLREVLRNFLYAKGALSSENIKFDL